jgi:SAM-dependent methyltransferase
MYGVLKSARRYGHCDNYVIMDAFEIPFPDGSLSTVIMNNLMHHLPSRVNTMREILRVLKEGGRLVFTDNTEGWGTYTWEQALLRKMRMNTIADKILAFKLRLFAQKLLVDDKYYEKRSAEMGYEIVRRIPFVSKQAMLLSSLFEFLNLKQGQPTRPEMKQWFRFFGCGKKINRYMGKIIEYCYRKNREQCEQDGYAFELFEIEKTTGGESVAGATSAADFVCPKCKGAVVKETESFLCKPCGISFPVFDGIPVFLSYQDKLKGLASYLTSKKEENAKDYMT